MFEKYLQKLLKQFLGEFIEEIDSKQLNIGIWSGKVDIKCLKIKKNVFQKYHLPIYIKHSSIKGLSLKIPWKNLFGSPLIITIESVLVLCEFAKERIPSNERIDAMIDLINNTIRLIGSQLVQKAKQKSQLKQKSGLIDRLSYKMFDNLYLSVKNIHIRFQQKDTGGTLKYGYCFGCSLQSIEVFAVNQNNQKVFIDRSKMQASETFLRKKIEMKNLSVYCNYGESDFITDLESKKNEKTVEEKLLKLIYTRETFNSNKNKNNYILIMNVFGFIQEDHRQAIVNYDIKLNFQKLIIKIDKQFLNCCLAFTYKLKQLDKKYNSQIVKKQLSKQDDLLFRKYCNAYLSDFKTKDFWTSKDRDQLESIVNNLHETVIIEKVKFIVINQMSVAQLSKFLALKGQDLDKGLLEVSKDIKDLQQPKTKIQITIPQITLYLVNQFSESILQLNILSISLSYFQKIINQNKVKFIDFYIHNISAVNNNLYILSTDQQIKSDKFFQCSLEIEPQVMKIDAKISTFNFYYDFQTIYKINELFHLRQIQNKYRNMALDRINQIQTKINTKVKQSAYRFDLILVVYKPKIFIREGKVNWFISTNQIEISYSQKIKINLYSLKVVFQRQKEDYLFIQPFNIAGFAHLKQQQTLLDLNLTPITINLQYFIYNSICNLQKYLFVNKKNDIINKSSKSGEIFLKQTKWKKCFATLLDNHLFGWQNQNEYPLFNIQIRSVQKVKCGKIDVLEASDKKKIYQLAFKDEILLEDWLRQLKRITENPLADKVQPNLSINSSSTSFAKVIFEALQINLFHHRFNKQQNQFQKQLIVVTNLGFQNLKLEYKYQKKEAKQSTKLDLTIQDAKFKQNNQQLIMHNTKTEPMIKVKLISQPTDSDGSESQVKIYIRSFQFHYKPTAILKIFGFFQGTNTKNNAKGQKYEAPKNQNMNKIITYVELIIQDATILLENNIIQMALAKLKCPKLEIKLISKYSQLTVSGIAQNVSLLDLTNYPFTVFEPQNIQICERQILQSEGITNKIDFQLCFPSQDSEIISSAKVQLNNLKINYSQEVVLRVIDYLNFQILGVIGNPSFYPQYYCQFKYPKAKLSKNYIKKAEQLFRMKYLSKLGKQKSKQMLQKSKPLLFEIEIYDSVLNIIGDYQNGSGVLINIKNASISNTSVRREFSIDSKSINLAYDQYNIELKGVSIALKDCEQRFQISSKIYDQISSKLRIEYFGGLMDYQYIMEGVKINNFIKVDMQVSMIKLHLNQKIISFISKVLNRNIFQEDGINFLMLFEIFEGPESLLDVKISSDLLIIELKLIGQENKISMEMGNFCYQYNRNPQAISKKITNKYIISNFVDPRQEFKEVITSRKIFRRVSNRGTLYTQLHSDNKSFNFTQDASFRYQSIKNRKQNKIESMLNAKELMLVFNIDYIIYLQKIKINNKQTLSFPRVYKRQQDKQKQLQAFQMQQIKLDKILLCAQVQKSDIIISVLLTLYFSKDQNKMQVLIPDMQAFISNTQHIACDQLSEMKKRTLLKQTHLKIIRYDSTTQFKVGKCFFKISINDLKSFHEIYSLNVAKYQQFQINRIKDHQFGQQIQSVVDNNQIEKTKAQKGSKRQKKVKEQGKIRSRVDFSQEKIILQKIQSRQKQLGEISLQTILIPSQHITPSISPQSSGQIQSQQFIFNLDTIQMMLVDDLNDLLTPLVYINLKLDLNENKKAIIQVYGDYFNLRNTLWQPLVEKCTIIIDYNKKILIQSDSKQYININISSNFIENIIKTINHKQLKSSRLLYLSQNVDRDQINSWIIINQLGEDIYCQSLDNQHHNLFIPKGQAQTLSFISRGATKEFKERQNEDLFIKLVIGQKLTIKKLKINELGLKRLSITLGENNQIVIVKNLYIDLSKNIKYLTLSSEIVFQNKSDITITIRDNKYNKNIYLHAFKTISLPYYCQLSSITYFPNESNDQSHDFTCLDHCSKLQINGKLFNIALNHRKLKKHFSFIPLYKITNYLPFPILINFKVKDKQALYCSLDLRSYENQNGNYGYLYKSIDDLQVSVSLQNYQCTDFFKLKKLIELRDYGNNTLTIKSQQYKDNSKPMIHIALMINYIIRNQTKEIFDAWADAHWIPSIKPGEYFVSENNQINLILHGFKSEVIYLTKKISCVSIRNKENEVIKSQSDYCIYRNLIEYDISNDNRMNFFISELIPMYNFKNENNYNIVLRQNGSGVGQIQLIKAKNEQNIKWFIDSTRRKNPLFKFTIENSNYDWSYYINIQIIKKTYFVLRNKFNYLDIKYFYLNIKKIKQAYQIYCKQLCKQQIPYIVRNNTIKYNIYIQSLKIILKPMQQTFFAWEDPTTSQKKIKIKIFKKQLILHKDEGKLKYKDDFINYDIKVDSFQQDNFKSTDHNLQIEVINQINKQIYIISDEPKDGTKSLLLTTLQAQLPIRIGLINNSFSPAVHIFDFATYFHLCYESYTTNKKAVTISMKQIQLDNQTKPLTFFPVVLSTNLQIRVDKGKIIEVELVTDTIHISIQEDFISDLIVFLTYLQSLVAKQAIQIGNQTKQQTFFISKLILPRVTIELEIQTKKFSIETSINLQKPQITSFPWKNVPYPIKTIAINILSHLSISPWAFITSFGKGLSMLITQQQTSKGFEGFFQQLIGGFSNSINGMVGMIIGHDIQKVDNFLDGLSKGIWALGASLYEIIPNFQGDYSPINIVKQVGSSTWNLVFKPITGILRMTLKISEGIKKTTKFEFDLTSKKFKKRFPLVFFNRQQTFSSYDNNKSELINRIKRSLLNQIKYFYLIEAILIEYRLRNQKLCLLLGAQQLILFNMKTDKMVWKLEIQKIVNIQIHNLCTIQFIVNPSNQNFENKRKFQVDINSQESVKKVIGIIEKTKKILSIEV